MNQLTFSFTVDGDYAITPESLKEAITTAYLQGGGEGPAGLSVVITSAEAIQAYNRDYAGKDEPTDVLSFPAEDEPYMTEPDEPPYLGDILIAYPIAEKQAAEQGHSPLREIQTLAVHGTLHLLGYDHGTEAEHAEMYGLQAKVMATIE